MKKNNGSVMFDFIVIILLGVIMAFGGVYVYQNYIKEERVTIKDELSKYTLEDENLRYYYSQLDDLGKLIYLKVNDNKDNLKSGIYEIEFGDEMNSILNGEADFDELEKDYKKALDAYVMDNPDMFYIDTSKMVLNICSRKTVIRTTHVVSISAEDGKNYYAKGITSENQVNEMLKTIDDNKKQIIASINGNNVDKIKQINDYIVDNFEYYNNDTEDVRTVYAALVNKKVVCEGYARTFQYIMNELKIPNILVIGDGNNKDNIESHAWNYVQIDNKWYAVDVTWDDPVLSEKQVLTKEEKVAYLLKGSKTFNSNHKETGIVSKNGLTVVYPQLSEEDFNI